MNGKRIKSISLILSILVLLLYIAGMWIMVAGADENTFLDNGAKLGSVIVRWIVLLSCIPLLLAELTVLFAFLRNKPAPSSHKLRVYDAVKLVLSGLILVLTVPFSISMMGSMAFLEPYLCTALPLAILLLVITFLRFLAKYEEV